MIDVTAPNGARTKRQLQKKSKQPLRIRVTDFCNKIGTKRTFRDGGESPLSEVKRTLRWLVGMSANDSKRTFNLRRISDLLL